MNEIWSQAVQSHQEGDFPISDEHAKKIISFPCDQHLEKEELDYIINTVSSFYSKSKSDNK